MRFLRAKDNEENKEGYEIIDIPVNEWIKEPPYAIEQGVIIQDYDDNVSLSWVGCSFKKDENGIDKISGLFGGYGPKPIKYWMKIPFPHEDLTGWHSEYVEGTDFPRKKDQEYLVCVEVQEYGCTTYYELRVARYSPSKKGDWAGLGYVIHNSTRSIIAWREIPSPKR